MDTKSLNDIRFPHSLINPHQLKHLKSVGDLCPAGYVICFRPINRVYFAHWFHLEQLQPRESLKPEQLIDLGPVNFFDVKKVFSCHSP